MSTDMYKALKSAGVEDGLATAAARGLPDDPVTQAQLEAAKWALGSQLTKFRTELKADMAELRGELKTDVAELRTELKADVAELRIELKADVAEIRTDVERIEKRMTWRMVVIYGIFSSIQTSVTVALIQALA